MQYSRAGLLPALLAGAVLAPTSFARAQPAAQGTFDGSYRGTAVAIGSSGPHCHWNPSRIRVRNNQINRPIAGAPVTAAIAPDGSFAASSSHQDRRGDNIMVMFSGRIAQGALEGTVQAARCTYQLSYRLIEPPAAQPPRMPGNTTVTP